MRCFFTFALAAALAAGWNATTWSQTSGTGTPGASGNVGTATPGASGNAGTAGTAGTTGAAGTAGTGTGTAGTGTTGASGPAANVGTNAAGTGVGNVNNNRANGVGINNRANGPGINNRANGVGRANNANANNVQAALQNNGVTQTPFFSDPGARRQLNLNDTQYNSLNQAYQNSYARYIQAVNNLDPNLPPQQRDMQLQQLQAQFNQSLAGTVNSTLTNPQSQSRFNQLNRQYNGFNAFNDPAVRKQLNLTQEQIRQLRTLSGNWRQQLQQFRASGGSGQTNIDPAQWTQMQQQFATQLNGVLTPEQQQMWTQQTGQAYSFSPNVYFGADQAAGIGTNGAAPVGPIPAQDVLKTQPNGNANTTNRPGTQTQPAATQPAATQPGATRPTSTQPATQGGTASGASGTAR